MSSSSIKNNGFSYLNNGATNGSNGHSGGGSGGILSTLMSGAIRNNNNTTTPTNGSQTHQHLPKFAPLPPNGNDNHYSSNNNNNNNNGFPNLDLKQQVTETCESFEVSHSFLFVSSFYLLLFA